MGTPLRPLPVDNSVMLIQSLLLSGTVLPDKQLRHLLAWVAGSRLQQLTPQQLAVLRQYTLFLLAQPDVQARGSILRLPVEVQRFVSGILRHRAPAWIPATSDTTRRFRAEVIQHLAAIEGGTSTSQAGVSAGTCATLSLGPAGIVDLHKENGCTWLLDGPEAFFRPFAMASGGLRYTPQERRRAWLLNRLLSDDDTRQCVSDFYPNATSWPKLSGPRRLSWLEWGREPLATRNSLFGEGRE